MTPPQIDLSDARWFPVDLHTQERRYGFLRIDDGVLERSSFLDTRIDARLTDAVPVASDALGELVVASGLAWLFHTSFCGSTLLARVLHAPSYSVCLREPMVLRRLGDARHAGQKLGSLVFQSAALLSRPWHGGGRVVVKPTHAALNVAADLLEATPGSRAVVLTSTLDDFLVSNLKKTPESQAKIPQLAERAMKASGFHARLPQGAFEPPDLLCAAVLQWAAQRELVAGLADGAGASRLRVIDMDTLLDDLRATSRAVAEWLALDIPAAVLESRFRDEAGRNAKETESSYSASQRAEESRLVEQLFAGDLSRARAWAAANVLPFMRPEALDAANHWALK
ncbi:hypothetical protein ACFPOA_04885 [Lysobacter niabensis]|uniref:hypothetical protein n=1 Tax=Agrilutibacter niabensis TaxID=380628 RepID=UPI0036174BDB